MSAAARAASEPPTPIAIPTEALAKPCPGDGPRHEQLYANLPLRPKFLQRLAREIESPADDRYDEEQHAQPFEPRPTRGQRESDKYPRHYRGDDRRAPR